VAIQCRVEVTIASVLREHRVMPYIVLTMPDVRIVLTMPTVLINRMAFVSSVLVVVRGLVSIRQQIARTRWQREVYSAKELLAVEERDDQRSTFSVLCRMLGRCLSTPQCVLTAASLKVWVIAATAGEPC